MGSEFLKHTISTYWCNSWKYFSIRIITSTKKVPVAIFCSIQHIEKTQPLTHSPNYTLSPLSPSSARETEPRKHPNNPESRKTSYHTIRKVRLLTQGLKTSTTVPYAATRVPWPPRSQHALAQLQPCCNAMWRWASLHLVSECFSFSASFPLLKVPKEYQWW